MQFPWTCKLAVHSSGITSLGAIWAISVCGYCSHHRVTSEMWVRSWHRLPACWVISLCWTLVCAALLAHPSPFLLCCLLYVGFLVFVYICCVWLFVYIYFCCCICLYLLMVGAKHCWLRAKHTETCYIPTWIILLILIFFFSSYYYWCSWVPHRGRVWEASALCSGAWQCARVSAQALHGQAMLKTEEGYREGSTAKTQ